MTMDSMDKLSNMDIDARGEGDRKLASLIQREHPPEPWRG